jgi:site-specific DNA-methyltransferase (cytosine-N4-specific)
MLTDRDDLVIDIFGGSNTTGQVAEAEARRWMSFEALPEYVAASSFRFLEKEQPTDVLQQMVNRIMGGNSVDIESYRVQSRLDLREDRSEYGHLTMHSSGPPG